MIGPKTRYYSYVSNTTEPIRNFVKLSEAIKDCERHFNLGMNSCVIDRTSFDVVHTGNYQIKFI